MRHRSGPRAGRKYPRRKNWLAQRDLCYERAGGLCEVSGDSLHIWIPSLNLPDRKVWRRACDHIIPERWVRRFCKGADPHILENLAAVSPRIHSQKTAIEWRIFRGDMLGFQADLRRIGYSDEMVTRALRALVASAKEKENRGQNRIHGNLPGGTTEAADGEGTLPRVRKETTGAE